MCLSQTLSIENIRREGAREHLAPTLHTITPDNTRSQNPTNPTKFIISHHRNPAIGGVNFIFVGENLSVFFDGKGRRQNCVVALATGSRTCSWT